MWLCTLFTLKAIVKGVRRPVPTSSPVVPQSNDVITRRRSSALGSSCSSPYGERLCPFGPGDDQAVGCAHLSASPDRAQHPQSPTPIVLSLTSTPPQYPPPHSSRTLTTIADTDSVTRLDLRILIPRCTTLFATTTTDRALQRACAPTFRRKHHTFA